MSELTDLPTTDSGAIKKKHAMEWLDSLDDPDEEEVKDSVVVQPYDHSGSTYDEPFSQIRVTGTAEFITAVAKYFTYFLEYESHNTRLSINLKQLEDDDTGEFTDNYALYISVAERG